MKLRAGVVVVGFLASLKDILSAGETRSVEEPFSFEVAAWTFDTSSDRLGWTLHYENERVPQASRLAVGDNGFLEVDYTSQHQYVAGRLPEDVGGTETGNRNESNSYQDGIAIRSPVMSYRVEEKVMIFVRMKYSDWTVAFQRGREPVVELLQEKNGIATARNSLLISLFTGDVVGPYPTCMTEAVHRVKEKKDHGERCLSSSEGFIDFYAPVYTKMSGTITGFLIHLFGGSARSSTIPTSQGAQHVTGPVGSMRILIDSIRLLKSPTILKVEGCLNKYFSERDASLRHPLYVEQRGEKAGSRGEGLPTYYNSRNSSAAPMLEREDREAFASSYPRGVTYNCPRMAFPSPRSADGGSKQAGTNVTLIITGKHFGRMNDIRIGYDEQPCTDVIVVRQNTVLACSLPVPNISSLSYQNSVLASNDYGDKAMFFSRLETPREPFVNLPVRVQNADYHALFDIQHYLSYAVAPLSVYNVNVREVQSHAVGLVWNLFSNGSSTEQNVWNDVTVTGFLIVYKKTFHHYRANQWFRTGLSTTSSGFRLLRHADGSSSYRYVSTIPDQEKGLFTDPNEFLTCVFVKNITNTSLVNLEPETDYLIRLAAINEEFPYFLEQQQELTTPDKYARKAHHESALIGAFSVPLAVKTGHYEVDIEDFSRLNNTEVEHMLIMNGNAGVKEGLVLTEAKTKLTSTVFYSKQVNIKEGFRTTFVVRVSNRSEICRGEYEKFQHCHSKGAEGVAFLVYRKHGIGLGDDHPPLGVVGKNSSGMGTVVGLALFRDELFLGYVGLKTVLAVQLDTYYNYELYDLYENSVSVFTSLKKESSFENHLLSPSFVAGVPLDVTFENSNLTVVIEYFPEITEDLAVYLRTRASSEQLNLQVLFHENLEEVMNRSTGDQLGVLRVFVYPSDSEKEATGIEREPDIVTLINLKGLFETSAIPEEANTQWLTDQDGKDCYVGFAAATGEIHYQRQEISTWHFQSLRQSKFQVDDNYLKQVIHDMNSGV